MVILMSLRRLAILALTALAALSVAHGSVRPALAQSPNPCVAALATSGPAALRSPADRAAKYGRFGVDTRDVRDVLQFSSAASQTRARAATASVSRPLADRDDNNIAILEDHGDLIIRPNPFDLANTGVRFDPAGGGYATSTTGGAFRDALGRAVTLGDDDSVSQAIAFPFEFYGKRATSLFVNSDGNLTFESGDNASTERGIDRLVSGAPRIAPFFADLDPSAGGRIFVDSAPDAATITWCAVPGFGVSRAITMQAVLFSGGAIEFRFGASDLRDGIVALSPGRTDTFTAININSTGGGASGAAAIGEQFIASASLDLVAASRRFYDTHPDDFDQLVFWTDTPAISEAFAFEVTVQNAITGTGLEVFNFSDDLGSAGALQSVVHMDRISKYPDTPSTKLFGESTTLGILAHETGHRWLANLRFRDVDRAISDQLLGRQRAHWSFFMDSDGSVMEGNDIEDLGGGAFRTVAATEKYSRLDLYAMGLASDVEVPRWFYIDAPASRDREDSPLAGITVNGTRRDVLIQDVIDALGPRVPDAAASPRLHRQAFVFVRGNAVLDPQDLGRLGRIREQFGPFFNRATEHRMTVRTTLTP
jgi:hypothetical protein